MFGNRSKSKINNTTDNYVHQKSLNDSEQKSLLIRDRRSSQGFNKIGGSNYRINVHNQDNPEDTIDLEGDVLMTETPLNQPSKFKKPVEINSISSSDQQDAKVPKDKFERIFYKRQKAEDLARRKEI